SSADCAPGTACNLRTRSCGPSCNGGLLCNGGCCDGTSCVAGTTDSSCGQGGTACFDCASSPSGPLCVSGGVCGCVFEGDCASGQACDPRLHQCGAPCDSGVPCGGGCCSAASNGTCQPGT